MMNYDQLIDDSRILAQATFSLAGESADKQTPLENSLLERWANEALRNLSGTNCIQETKSLGTVATFTADDTIPYVELAEGVYKIRNVYLKSGTTWIDLKPAASFAFSELVRRLSAQPEFFSVGNLTVAGVNDKNVLFICGSTTGFTVYADVYSIHPTLAYKDTTKQFINIPLEYQDALVMYMEAKIFEFGSTAQKDAVEAQKYFQVSMKKMDEYRRRWRQLFADKQYEGKQSFSMCRDSY
jgi:hypothetical protein